MYSIRNQLVLVLTAIFLAHPLQSQTINCTWNIEYDGIILGRANKWDGYPTHLLVGGTHHIWWCGTSSTSGSGSAHTDGIFLATKSGSLGPGGWSAPQEVFNNQQTAWATNHVCDPSVAKGSFQTTSGTFSYALYYTADTSPTNPGADGAIGVAFSNNGRSWIDQPDPVITPEAGFNGGYGAGMSGVAWDGPDLIHAYLDSTVSPILRIRESADGLGFSSPSTATQLHAGGRQSDGQGPDIAFNASDQHWYAVIKNTDPGGIYDGETRVLRSANPLDLFGSWEVVGIFNSTNTGFQQNHNPGLAKNVDGTLFTDSQGWHYLFLTVGNVLPDWKSWEVAQGRFRRICSIASP